MYFFDFWSLQFIDGFRCVVDSPVDPSGGGPTRKLVRWDDVTRLVRDLNHKNHKPSDLSIDVSSPCFSSNLPRSTWTEVSMSLWGQNLPSLPSIVLSGGPLGVCGSDTSSFSWRGRCRWLDDRDVDRGKEGGHGKRQRRVLETTVSETGVRTRNGRRDRRRGLRIVWDVVRVPCRLILVGDRDITTSRTLKDVDTVNNSYGRRLREVPSTTLSVISPPFLHSKRQSSHELSSRVE